ncbi:MAG TPA: hypothetical protein PKA64_25205, partial [Myxococcota bacterium]|nr:hypothetical protein [Myxococcota bacterium]
MPPLLFGLLLACSDPAPHDPCSAGEAACWEEPAGGEPDAAVLADMDALCSLGATVPAPALSAGAAPDDVDHLQPTPYCRTAMEATLPWGPSIPEGSPVRASVIDALWLVFYAPLIRQPEGPLLGAVPTPVEAPALIPLDTAHPPATGWTDPEHPWSNHQLRHELYTRVTTIAFVDAHVSDGVKARYASGTMTVFHSFFDVSVAPDGAVDWAPDGDRYVSAGILVHETMHGMGEAWRHEYCPFETPGVDAAGCDDHADVSAYAHEVAFLDALALGVMYASADLGYRLVPDAPLADALDSACDAARRVEDWAFPTGCAG